MTGIPDRRAAVALVAEARAAGARLKSACAELGIGVNTYRRWAASDGDRRPQAMRPTPANALSKAEREEILALCHSPAFASLPPAQIVVRLLDEDDRYLASESTFYRVLRANGEQHRRGRAGAPRNPAPPRRHRAEAPKQLWSWDVTYLPSNIRGLFYYLYLIVDIYSRKIVGAEVFAAENGANSAQVIECAVLRERCAHQPLVLHADNGGPMKGSALYVTLERLGITPSHSRAQVSNDNAYSEALFRTCKYRPGYPPLGFASLHEARRWVQAFVDWYNREHRHSAIRYLTPEQRHRGLDQHILAKRSRLYARARERHPQRWSGALRDWSPIGAVWLNEERDKIHQRIQPAVLEAA